MNTKYQGRWIRRLDDRRNYKKKYYLFIVLFFFNYLFSQTDISGNIQGIWTEAGNPYNIIGPCTITTGNTLTIQQGVEIYFQIDTSIIVEGTLNILGIEEDSVIITVDPAYITQFAGIRFYGGNGIISYASIQNGYADNALPGDRGGSIYFDGSALQINHCNISYSSADGLGGGIAILGPNAIIENNKIHHNSAIYGGGIWTGADDTIIRNNYFYANTVNNSGGGVHVTGNNNQPRIEKNIFYENLATGGGGIGFNAGNNAIVINNIFYNNYASGSGGGARIKLHETGSHPKMINNIFWDNNAADEGDQIYIENGATLTINNCAIQGGMAAIASYGTLNYGPNNISTAPLFVDAANLDFHLLSGSPCIDAGADTLSPPTTDFDGNPTNQDGNNDGTPAYDIGSFEYINTPPVITSTPVDVVNENESYFYQVIAEDPDPGDNLTYELTVNPAFLIIDDNSGEITGNPSNEDIGFHPVTVRVSDSHGGTDIQSFTLEVVEVFNDPPIVDDIPNQTVAEGGIFTAILLNNYVDDPDDPDSEINWVASGNVDLSVNISAANVATIAIPNANWYGSETITFTAVDGGGLTDSDAATFTVTPINDPPIVSNIPNRTVAEGSNFPSINLDQYVSDIDNPDDELTWTTSATNNITVTILNRIATITANDPDWNGNETVTFIVEDPGGLTDNDEATFIVTAVNDAPIVTNIPNQSVTEGITTFESINLDNYVSDPDNSDGELIWTASSTNHITVNITDHVASITVNNSEWNGSENVTFIAEDPAGLTGSDNVSFTVTSVNDPPVVANIPNQTIPEGGSFTAIILDNYVSDPDNADTEINWTASATAHITITITNRIASISVNDSEWNGNETVTFTAEDPGELTDNDNVTFTVSSLNDPPVVMDIPDQSIAEGNNFTSISLDDFVNDADNLDSEINWTASATTNVIVVITDRIATISVDDQNWNGSESVTFTAEDPNGLTDSDDASFTVLPVNDPPAIANIPDQTIPEDGSFASIMLDNYVTDPDNADAEISWSASATTNITVTITDRVATITINDPEWGGSETVTFTAEDPAGLKDSDDATFIVNAVNEPPQIFPIPALKFNEDDSLVLAISELYDYVEDPDNPDSLLIFMFKAGRYVTTYYNSSSIIIKDPPNWNGLDTLEIKVSDGEFADSLKITVSVKSINDMPFFVGLPDEIGIVNTHDSTFTMKQYAMDVDAPNDNLTWIFETSNSVLNLDFDDVSTDLTLSAPGYEGLIKVKCTITDDSSASAIDSFYVYVDDPTAIEDMAGIIPLEYKLDQNYPNPFNPSTQIHFGMKKSGDVKIEIYNILGQKVQTLWDGRKEAGYHIIKFNAGDLASGLYFYKMETGKYTSIKKMIIMK